MINVEKLEKAYELLAEVGELLKDSELPDYAHTWSAFDELDDDLSIDIVRAKSDDFAGDDD